MKLGGPPLMANPPLPNHHFTQGPRLLSEPHLYAPPSIHFKIFFQTEKKKQAEKTPVFFFLSLTKHSSPKEGKSPRRFPYPLTH